MQVGSACPRHSIGNSGIIIAAQCIGIGQAALESAVRYSQQRETFGKPVAQHQAIQFMLADMATEIKLGNLMLLEAAWKIDQGTVTPEDCAMAKLYCSEMLARVADQAQQTVGGMGLMEELPLERIWRDARIERIWDGTSEIQRHIISRGLLRPLGA